MDNISHIRILRFSVRKLRKIFAAISLMSCGMLSAQPPGTQTTPEAYLPDSANYTISPDSAIHVSSPETNLESGVQKISETPGHETEIYAPAAVEINGQPIAAADTLTWDMPTGQFEGYDVWIERDVVFNPSPTRAVWMSALFPGLGQVYNRRYWKLPIIVGGYLGLAYATSWNNTMLTDYQRAYMDIMDNDPTTNSYMDFFPPTTQESDLDKTWLTNLLKSRKDFYRRNRDLCIIGMVGVYLLAMVDAYVDASLSHFDITPDLSIDVTPSLIQDARNTLPGIGMTWAFNF